MRRVYRTSINTSVIQWYETTEFSVVESHIKQQIQFIFEKYLLRALEFVMPRFHSERYYKRSNRVMHT